MAQSQTDRMMRYLWETQAHANELLEMYDLEIREHCVPQLERNWQAFELGLLSDPKEALVFLGDGPTARHRRVGKMDPDDALHLWCKARYLALLSASTLETALAALDVLGMPYRKAARKGAQVALQDQVRIDPETVLLLELPD